MKKLQKEVIKSLYKSADYERKEKIKECFPEVFELPETGWLKSKSTDTILYRCGNNLGYGKYYDGWVDRSAGYSFESDPENWQPAAEPEVKEMLIEEAKRRGVWDCPIIDVEGDVSNEADWYKEFNIEANQLFSEYGLIFDNGKWATPIEEPKTETIHLFGNTYKISLVN